LGGVWVMELAGWQADAVNGVWSLVIDALMFGLVMPKTVLLELASMLIMARRPLYYCSQSNDHGNS